MKKGCFITLAIVLTVIFGAIYYIALNKDTLIVKYAFPLIKTEIENELETQIYQKIKDQQLKMLVKEKFNMILINIENSNYNWEELQQITQSLEKLEKDTAFTKEDFLEIFKYAEKKGQNK